MEICPYHEIEPTIKYSVIREGIDKTYKDENGNTKKYVLPKLVVYKAFCPLCAASKKSKGVSKKFGKGYSAYSADTAIRRWNSACADERLKIFKNAVKDGR